MSDQAVYVHPGALCESDAVGGGTRIWAFTHVMAGSTIGERCNIGGHCFVEEGAIIGSGVTLKNGVSVWRGVKLDDNVFVGPNAVFTNDHRPRAEIKHSPDALLPTLVRSGATLGANSTVLCDTTVGAFAFVGAGAVVIADVPDHALVVGNPARQIGWACRCGRTLAENLTCSCDRRYRFAANGLAEIARP